MEPLEYLRSTLFSTTNNPELTNAIMALFNVAGDNTELLMKELVELVGYDMSTLIMSLADVAFGRAPALDVDPSYQDASVENEARPKHPTGCFVMELRPQGNPLQAARDEQQWQHIRKFNPMLEQEIMRFNNMSDIEKLIYITAKEMSHKYPIKRDPNRVHNPMPVVDFTDDSGRDCFYDENGQPWFRGDKGAIYKKYELAGERQSAEHARKRVDRAP
jgi:hypothetical protein